MSLALKSILIKPIKKGNGKMLGHFKITEIE